MDCMEKLIEHDDGWVGEAYDFSSVANKKSLKKWENELGIVHVELGLDWNKPVAVEKGENV